MKFLKLIQTTLWDMCYILNYLFVFEKETFSGIFLILETRSKNKITPKRIKKKTVDKPITFVSIKYSCQTILTFPGLLLIQTAK